jgi:hypothetical protein
MLSKQPDTKNFDLLREIGKEGTYHLLYPPQQAGLAILSLYQKIKSGVFAFGRFKESDIYSALESSKYMIKADEYERLPQVKFNNTISDLQVYFLRYDADEQIYTLKEYAEAFCRQAEETLMSNFNPTQIEMICNDLKMKLETCIDEVHIDKWVQTYFFTFRPIMKSQVERLERQIDKAVQDIRATTQLENLSIIDILQAIDHNLDALREQNIELRSAFREMKNINSLLNERLTIIYDVHIEDRVSIVRGFFPEIKYTLNLIDKRLDRIQPKLRQFFGMLNKPSFNVKVEKFLKFILSHSTLKNNKHIIFPKEIQHFIFRQQTANFTIFERRPGLFPTKPNPRIKHAMNEVERAKGFAMAKFHLSTFNKVEEYINMIIREAGSEETHFSKWFFHILDEEFGDIELASLVAYGLIRRKDWDKQLKLHITKNKIKHLNHRKVSIWEMIIQYQH